jgi:nucleotide-binding universal stress UspA family protein
MLRTILVPLDGSPLAEQALPHACRLARQTGADLVLLRAAPYVTNPGHPSTPLRVTVHDAATYLVGQRRELAEQGINARCEALHAAPLRAITFAARKVGADLIVMSTHGHSGLRRVLLGSVAEAVVQQSATPVFLVRADSPASAPSTGPYRRVLVPLDGSMFAETALQYLLTSGCNPQQVALLCATPTGRPPLLEHALDHAQPDEVQTLARRYLAYVTEHYLHGHASLIEVPSGHAGQAIADAAHAEHTDFIVMATHGHAGLDRLARGSVARFVLRHAPVPLLLVHGGAPAATAEPPSVTTMVPA